MTLLKAAANMSVRELKDELHGRGVLPTETYGKWRDQLIAMVVEARRKSRVLN